MKLNNRFNKENQRMVLSVVVSYLIFRYIFSNWDVIELIVNNWID